MARRWPSTSSQGEDVFAITFSPDGQQVVFGDQHGHLHAWDFTANKITKSFEAPVLFKTDRIQDIAGLRVLAFFDGGKLLLAAGTTPDKGATIQSTPTLLAFDFASGELKHKFTHGAVKDGFIEDLAIHPDGYVMAVTSGDPGNGKLLMIRLGEADAFDSATQLPNCQAIAIHPDGRRFAIASTNRDSNGNGRRTDKEGAYSANTFQNLFELPAKGRWQERALCVREIRRVACAWSARPRHVRDRLVWRGATRPDVRARLLFQRCKKFASAAPQRAITVMHSITLPLSAARMAVVRLSLALAFIFLRLRGGS